MARLVLCTTPTELVKQVNELAYLQEKLKSIEDAEITDQLWLDFYESWVAVLALRSKMDAACAQQVLDAIVTDNKVLSGLAAAYVLRDSIFKGKPPQELLQQLKQGPGGHIKSHAYEYRRKIDQEIARIGRIQTLQQRGVALTGTVLISVSIGISNYVSRTVFEMFNST